MGYHGSTPTLTLSLSMIDKLQVARILKEVSLLLQLRGESAFKARAYEIAADRMLGHEGNLQLLVESSRLTDLPGIGPSLAHTITEIVRTGALNSHRILKDEFPTSLFSLLSVPEIGAKKAALLWKMLGVSDLDSLEAACQDGSVQTLKGFGPKSSQKLLAAVHRQRTTQGQFLLGQVLPIAEGMIRQLNALPCVENASLAGSARRWQETVSDIDLVVGSENSTQVFRAFSGSSGVDHLVGQGESKCSVRLKEGNLQVDLRVLPPGDFATALHHFTGSKAHHIRLRGRGKAQNLKISEWGVFQGDGGEKLEIEDESALYDALGMQYIPPELREDSGEFEAALEGRIPSNLIQESDITGIIHSHTEWSDGRHSIREMALAALRAGYQYLTVTDHSQSAFYAGGVKADDLPRQWDEIDRVNEELPGISILKGSEVDILENGDLDFPQSLLERLDVVIGSIHQRFKMNEEQMTHRVLKAFDNPCLDILGHPTGRLILKRLPFDLQIDKIFDKAARHRIALELNGSPHRLDLSASHARRASTFGVQFVLSTDAHSIAELGNVRFAAATGRRAWITRNQVLNALPKNDFLASLRRVARSH